MCTVKSCAIAAVLVSLIGACKLFAKPSTSPANRVALFDGKDLIGWRIVLEDKTVDSTKIWSAADRTLKFDTHQRGYAVTEKSFSSYRVQLEDSPIEFRNIWLEPE